MKRSFLDDADRNELSQLLTEARLKRAGVVAPPKGAVKDPDLNEILDHVRSSKAWKGTKKAVNRKAVRKLAGV